MAIDPNPPANLSPPPKFQSQTNPIIGPQTASEWADFWRWLFAQYLMVKYLAGNSVPPNTFPSSFPQQQVDSIPGQFPTFPPQLPDPGEIFAAMASNRQAVAQRTSDSIPQGFPTSPYASRRPIEIIICTQATFPTLTSGSIPVFVFVSDYVHLIYWDGTTAVFCGDQSGCISLWESNPGTGYHLCDGATVNRLNADGSLTSVTLPDLTSSGAAAAFLEGGTPNSGPTAAVAPTFAGNAVTGTVAAPAFTGTPAPITTDLFTPVALATAVMTSLDGSTTSYTPRGTNNAPAFTGNAATGTVSSTGEPRKLVRRPYYRL